MKVPPVSEARCIHAEFGALSADPALAPWPELQRLPLCLNKNGARPNQGTDVWVGRDAEALRVLFVAADVDPWATLSERDSPLYKEEVVEVFLDTEGDGDGYFEIEVNPNNAVLDGCMRRVRSGFRKDFRWRCDGLRTAVRSRPCRAGRAPRSPNRGSRPGRCHRDQAASRPAPGLRRALPAHPWGCPSRAGVRCAGGLHPLTGRRGPAVPTAWRSPPGWYRCSWRNAQTVQMPLLPGTASPEERQMRSPQPLGCAD